MTSQNTSVASHNAPDPQAIFDLSTGFMRAVSV